MIILKHVGKMSIPFLLFFFWLVILLYLLSSQLYSHDYALTVTA